MDKTKAKSIANDSDKTHGSGERIKTRFPKKGITDKKSKSFGSFFCQQNRVLKSFKEGEVNGQLLYTDKRE